MSWLRNLFGKQQALLTAEQGAALSAWGQLPELDPAAPAAEVRCVVLDVESSGLDPHHDRLISIGAMAVRDGALALPDSFEVVLRQEQVSGTDNILVHGIGGTAQREGIDPAEGLLKFLAYAQKAPVVAFHAPFDTIMIGRALKQRLGLKWKPRVLDLADLMPALFPEARNCKALDDWLARFGIGHYARHQALSDAFSTAQLLQVALAASPGATFSTLDRLQRDQKALARFESAR